MNAAANRPNMSTVLPPALKSRSDVFEPNYSLTSEQYETLGIFRSNLADLESEHSTFLDDACLCRYLRARDWKIKQAEQLLRDTIRWRAEYNVEGITPDDVYEEAKTGKNYLHGFDNLGRPVIYQRPRLENSKNYDKQVQLMAYLLERAGSSMDRSRGVEQHILFIDFKGYSIFNAPPLHVSKSVLSLLMDRYPERLGHAFLVDAPRLFLAAYATLKIFIPAATKAKIHLVKRKGNAGSTGCIDPEIAKYFEAENLEEEYGGLLPSYFDAEQYFAKEKELYLQLRNGEVVAQSASVSTADIASALDEKSDAQTQALETEATSTALQTAEITADDTNRMHISQAFGDLSFHNHSRTPV